MYVSYNKFLSIKKKLLAYIKRNKIKYNIKRISNDDLIKCGLCRNIEEVKDIRKYLINDVNHKCYLVERIIFNRFDSFDTAWQNRVGNKEIMNSITKRKRWKVFIKYIRV